jgi:eukaryotic-like serine/threonine-protein kinase
MLKTGQFVGPYQLIRKIGSGGFGIVWLAEKRSALVTTQYALKFPKDDSITLESIRQEIAIWAQVTGHPFILPLIEADIYDNQHVVIVTEYSSDGSLDTWLKLNRGKAPSIEAVIEIIDGILQGLEHLHRLRIAHRDLKPSNIILQRGIPRLADFGIATLLVNSLEHSDTIKGSISYLAPEAIAGKRSFQTDIWSIGIIFYLLLAGYLPFQGIDEVAVMSSIRCKEVPPLPPTIPPQLRTVVFRALEKDPKKRYASAVEMRKSLRHVVTNLISPSITSFTSTSVIAIANESSDNTVSPSGLHHDLSQEYTSEDMTFVKLKRFKFTSAAIISDGNTQRYKGKARYFKVSLNSDSTIDMVLIPAGIFCSTCAQKQLNQCLATHLEQQINLPEFFISKYPITQAQWRAVAQFPKVKRNLPVDPSTFKGDFLPVERVSWKDAVEFCARLSMRTGTHYRLPTEVEWEYACRAGGYDPYAFGHSIISDFVNFDKHYEGTTPVGSFNLANMFGLYDMHGNVYEWCSDAWSPNNVNETLPKEDVQRSVAPSRYRVRRGGSWQTKAIACSASSRSLAPLDLRHNTVGFRIACDRKR